MAMANAMAMAFVFRTQDLPHQVRVQVAAFVVFRTHNFPKLSDPEQLINTCRELRQLFPLQAEAWRQTKKIADRHANSVGTSMNVHEQTFCRIGG